jgi:AcrR family transcriptional regulator
MKQTHESRRVTRAERKQRTIASLLEAAINEIADNGIAGLSIDRLTDTAGYSRGAFYGNYRSKQDMLLEIMRTSAEQQLQGWQRFIDNFVDFEHFLKDICAQFDAYVESRNAGIFWIELSLHALRNEQFAQAYNHCTDTILKCLESLLVQIFEKTGQKPQVDCWQMACFIRNIVQGTILDPQRGKPSDFLRIAIRSLFNQGVHVASESSEKSPDNLHKSMRFNREHV